MADLEGRKVPRWVSDLVAEKDAYIAELEERLASAVEPPRPPRAGEFFLSDLASRFAKRAAIIAPPYARFGAQIGSDAEESSVTLKTENFRGIPSLEILGGGYKSLIVLPKSSNRISVFMDERF